MIYEGENLPTTCSTGDTQQDHTNPDFNALNANAVNDYVEYTVTEGKKYVLATMKNFLLLDMKKSFSTIAFSKKDGKIIFLG